MLVEALNGEHAAKRDARCARRLRLRGGYIRNRLCSGGHGRLCHLLPLSHGDSYPLPTEIVSLVVGACYDILEQILKVKEQEMANTHTSVDGVNSHDTMSLKYALSVPEISVIAEIKMQSPSAGHILPNADPVQIAKDYESAGAQAISVLTDEQFFGGNIGILEAVKKVVSIPVLRITIL